MSKYQFKYAAGIFLISFRNNRPVILLGEDQYEAFSDFGGRCEFSDKSEEETASRECYEETCAIVDSYTNLKKLCSESITVMSETFYKRPYYMFLCFIPFNEMIPTHFERAKNLIRDTPNMMQFKEKNRLKWMYWDDVKNNRCVLRNMFKITIAKNAKIIDNTILKFALHSKNTKVFQS
jgi:8-oxo-dGTP pyrophosphatase MutT (NUDIX family)